MEIEVKSGGGDKAVQGEEWTSVRYRKRQSVIFNKSMPQILLGLLTPKYILGITDHSSDSGVTDWHLKTAVLSHPFTVDRRPLRCHLIFCSGLFGNFLGFKKRKIKSPLGNTKVYIISRTFVDCLI